jgi:hypothetical protein
MQKVVEEVLPESSIHNICSHFPTNILGSQQFKNSWQEERCTWEERVIHHGLRSGPQVL